MPTATARSDCGHQAPYSAAASASRLGEGFFLTFGECGLAKIGWANTSATESLRSNSRTDLLVCFVFAFTWGSVGVGVALHVEEAVWQGGSSRSSCV